MYWAQAMFRVCRVICVISEAALSTMAADAFPHAPVCPIEHCSACDHASEVFLHPKRWIALVLRLEMAWLLQVKLTSLMISGEKGFIMPCGGGECFQ